MKLATREQIFEIDRIAAAEFGLGERQLIKKAGVALAERFEKLAHEFGIRKASRVGVWCGPGNNGHDGEVMAEELHHRGFTLIHRLHGTDWDARELDILIDAYFGVGLNRNVAPVVQEKIAELTRLKTAVIAIDVPTGLCANTGMILGGALTARATLTIYPPKPGLFLNQGPAHSGHIFSVSLGLPGELFSRPELLDTFLIDRKMARQLLPARKATANKTGFGHLLVVAGSDGMEGAAAMVCEAAARMGCGYVTLCSRSERAALRVRPDFLQLTTKDFLGSDLKKYHAVVIGPGLGRDSESAALLDHLLRHHLRVLVDADALTLLAAKPPRDSELPATWVLTPHAGELSRLLGVAAADLEADRLKAVREAQQKYGAVVLLKGFRTVLRDAQRAFVVYSGNVALAKAGSGDILAGFIGSLLAQGLESTEATALGAYLHGRIADDWVRRGGDARTLMASDLPELLNTTLRRLKKDR
jgi:NAD(P)H-hydrate epimerase